MVFIYTYFYTHRCVQTHILIYIYVYLSNPGQPGPCFQFPYQLFVRFPSPSTYVIAEVRGWAQVGGPFTINGCQGQSFGLKRYFLITENRDFPLACQFTWGYYVYCTPNHPPMVMNGQNDSHQAAQRFPSMSNLAIYSKPRCPRITQRMVLSWLILFKKWGVAPKSQLEKL